LRCAQRADEARQVRAIGAVRGVLPVDLDAVVAVVVDHRVQLAGEARARGRARGHGGERVRRRGVVAAPDDEHGPCAGGVRASQQSAVRAADHPGRACSPGEHPSLPSALVRT